MEGISRGEDSFGDTVAGTHNQIVSFEIEGLYRRWKQGEIVSVIFERPRKTLNIGGIDPHPLDRLRQLLLVIEECVKIGFREKLTQRLKALFPSSHAHQPVMNQGNPQCNTLPGSMVNDQ